MSNSEQNKQTTPFIHTRMVKKGFVQIWLQSDSFQWLLLRGLFSSLCNFWEKYLNDHFVIWPFTNTISDSKWRNWIGYLARTTSCTRCTPLARTRASTSCHTVAWKHHLLSRSHIFVLSYWLLSKRYNTWDWFWTWSWPLSPPSPASSWLPGSALPKLGTAPGMGEVQTWSQ